MTDSYPEECKKGLLAELRKLSNNPGHRRSIKLMDKFFKPIRKQDNGIRI
jgi:hypothetical protein